MTQTKVNLNNNKLIFYLSLLFFVLSVLTFIFTPFTGDLHVLFAGSKQADYIEGNWIYKAFNVWDLKGELYRLFLFIFYKLTIPVASFPSYNHEIATNILFVICSITIITFANILLLGHDDKKKLAFYTTVSCTVIFATLPMAHIQTEMISAIKLFFAFCLYANAKRTNSCIIFKLLLAGIIIGTIFFYKSVLILLAFSFVSAIILYNYKNGYHLSKKEIIAGICGSFITLTLVGLLIYYINPSEFQNMLDASIYQNTLITNKEFSILKVLFRFGFKFVYNLLTYPFILFSFSLAIINVINDIKNKKTKYLICRLLLWVIPSIILILANNFFDYHYCIFLFVALIEIICFDWTEYRIEISKKELIVYSIIILFVFILAKSTLILYSTRLWQLLIIAYLTLLIFFNFKNYKKIKNEMNIIIPAIIGITVYISFISIFSDNFIDYVKYNKEMYANNKNIISIIQRNDSIMYLDDGLGAYLINDKSYLKEYYPLPLQRIYEGSKHIEAECHKRALKKALSYQGEYISLYETWMFGEKRNRNLELQNKIEKEYNPIGEIKLFSISPNIFSKVKRNEKHVLKILKRL